MLISLLEDGTALCSAAWCSVVSPRRWACLAPAEHVHRTSRSPLAKVWCGAQERGCCCQMICGTRDGRAACNGSAQSRRCAPSLLHCLGVRCVCVCVCV